MSVREVKPAVALELADLPFPCLAEGGEVVLGPDGADRRARGPVARGDQPGPPARGRGDLRPVGGRRCTGWRRGIRPGPGGWPWPSWRRAPGRPGEAEDRTADLLAVVARTADSRDRARAAAEAATALAVVGRTADAARLVEDVTATDASLLTVPALVAVRASLLLNQGVVSEALEVVDAALEARDLVRGRRGRPALGAGRGPGAVRSGPRGDHRRGRAGARRPARRATSRPACSAARAWR